MWVSVRKLMNTDVMLCSVATTMHVRPVDPLFVNALYYLTATHGEACAFETDFWGWTNINLDEAGFDVKKNVKEKYSRILQLLFDIMHHQNLKMDPR